MSAAYSAALGALEAAAEMDPNDIERRPTTAFLAVEEAKVHAILALVDVVEPAVEMLRELLELQRPTAVAVEYSVDGPRVKAPVIVEHPDGDLTYVGRGHDHVARTSATYSPAPPDPGHRSS